MYGDPDAIRALARALRDRAEQIRDEADQLVARTDATAWTGTAADAMRARVRSSAGGLRQTASLHDDAADALDKHAGAAEGILEEIARIEGGVTHALHTVGDAVGHAAQAAEHHFEAPIHGSLDWLHVHVPHWLGGAA